MERFLVAEGFGVCGAANNIEIKTTTLHSCSAIIMFNAPGQVLGLFHYPGENLTGAGIQGAIIGMINDIAPTQLVLWTAVAHTHGYGGIAASEVLAKRIVLDNAKVRTFLELKKASNCTLDVVTGKTFPGVKVSGGKLAFAYVDCDQNVPGKATIEAGDQPVARRQLGNIWFYYGSAAGPSEYSRKIAEIAQRIVDIEHGRD